MKYPPFVFDQKIRAEGPPYRLRAEGPQAFGEPPQQPKFMLAKSHVIESMWDLYSPLSFFFSISGQSFLKETRNGGLSLFLLLLLIENCFCQLFQAF